MPVQKSIVSLFNSCARVNLHRINFIIEKERWNRVSHGFYYKHCDTDGLFGWKGGRLSRFAAAKSNRIDERFVFTRRGEFWLSEAIWGFCRRIKTALRNLFNLIMRMRDKWCRTSTVWCLLDCCEKIWAMRIEQIARWFECQLWSLHKENNCTFAFCVLYRKFKK